MKLRQWIRRRGSGVWSAWPLEAYRQQRYQQRLVAVQEHLAERLDLAPDGPVSIVSMCAGDGRDVIDVVASHKRRNDVVAWLVELDHHSVAVGVRHATSVGLENTVNFLNDDATVYATYKNAAPADIVLVCGVWGHVPTQERVLLVRAVASMCKPRATVIWTRGVSQGMARLQEIESLFAGGSWQKIRVSLTPDQTWAVATHRYCGPRVEVPESGRIFHFQRRAGR